MMHALVPHRTASFLRDSWVRVCLRGVHFADRRRRLDVLYRIRDPWGMESERQRFRFRETNRLIREQFGSVGKLLEIGCGEGHQSEELLGVCDQLVGIDISARAVERARERCPDATFAVGDVFDSDAVADGAPFDLVVGCEVLYYMKDVLAALQRFSQIGAACLVTYYQRPAEHLDPLVLAIPGVDSTRIECGDSGWTAAWWRTAAQE